MTLQKKKINKKTNSAKNRILSLIIQSKIQTGSSNHFLKLNFKEFSLDQRTYFKIINFSTIYVDQLYGTSPSITYSKY